MRTCANCECSFDPGHGYDGKDKRPRWYCSMVCLREFQKNNPWVTWSHHNERPKAQYVTRAGLEGESWVRGCTCDTWQVPDCPRDCDG